MRISEILSPDRIRCNVATTSKKGALEEMSRLLASAESSLTYTEIFDCLNARERLGSTGLGRGVAIPHGRFQPINVPTAAFLRLETGVDYDAIDQQPVDVLFGLLVPPDATNEHLQLLSSLAEMCCRDDLLQRLRKESSPEKIYEILAE